MAQIIPETGRSYNRSEMLLARALKELPDDYIVYHEPYIKNRRPDFVIIGPDLGVIVLEAKDYAKCSIVSANRDEWILQCNDKIINHISPLAQARKYAQDLNDILRLNNQLVMHEGPYKGNMRFPYGYGVAFTKLTQRDMVQTELYNIIPPELCLTREDIDPDNEIFSKENLLEKICGLFPIKFNNWGTLTEEDIKAIRYLIFPEVRISANKVAESTVYYEEQVLFSLKDIKVMDLHQENLAKSIGDKHRLLRGVAGSGKTLILACRAKYLSRANPNWRIMVLCYNVSLANFIKQMIDEIEIETPANQIEVHNFHYWCAKTWGLKDEGLIDELTDRVKNGDVESPKYDAILIDEGQDFEPSWLRLAYAALNPETHSFLLVEDRAQQIYHRSTLAQELGISFQGRSKILTVNYRNTEQIITLAWNFYQHFSSPDEKPIRDEIVEIISPKSAHRTGPVPVIKEFSSFIEEARTISKEIKKLNTDGMDFSDIAVLYRVKKLQQDYTEIITKCFQEDSIPYYWLSENNISKRNFQRRESTVKISTVESAKGLEFKAVFICNLDNFPLQFETTDLQREVSLLYIGMTRAVDRLYLSYSGKSIFTDYFAEKIKKG